MQRPHPSMHFATQILSWSVDGSTPRLLDFAWLALFPALKPIEAIESLFETGLQEEEEEVELAFTRLAKKRAKHDGILASSWLTTDLPGR